MNAQELYLLTDIARLNAEVAGMQAENTARERQGLAPAYTEGHFLEAIKRNGLEHNQVVPRVRDAV